MYLISLRERPWDYRIQVDYFNQRKEFNPKHISPQDTHTFVGKHFEVPSFLFELKTTLKKHTHFPSSLKRTHSLTTTTTTTPVLHEDMLEEEHHNKKTTGNMFEERTTEKTVHQDEEMFMR